MAIGRDVPFAGSTESLPKKGEPATILWESARRQGLVKFAELLALRQRVHILNLTALGDPLMEGDTLEMIIAATLLPG